MDERAGSFLFFYDMAEKIIKALVWLIAPVMLLVLFLVLADYEHHPTMWISVAMVIVSYLLIMLATYSDKERAGVLNMTTIAVATINFVLELTVAILFILFWPDRGTAAFVIHFILLCPTLLVMGLSYLANKNTRRHLEEQANGRGPLSR